MAVEFVRVETNAGVFHVPKHAFTDFRQLAESLGVFLFNTSEHVLCETRLEWECQLSMFARLRDEGQITGGKDERRDFGSFVQKNERE